MTDNLFFFPYETATPSVGRQKMIVSIFNLLFIIHNQTLYDYHFSKFIHFWCHFTPSLNPSDMIATRSFRRQFFTHRGTSLTSFHVTIRSNVSCILQPSNFLSILCLLLIDGATVLSAILNYTNLSPKARNAILNNIVY